MHSIKYVSVKQPVFNYQDLKLNADIDLAKTQINRSQVANNQTLLFNDDDCNNLNEHIISVKAKIIDQKINVVISCHEIPALIQDNIYGW